MNKLLTYVGAQPIYLGDIDFMQQAYAYTATLLARALMGSSSNGLYAILQGVEISYGSDVISWTAGVVVISGEILPVLSGSVSGSLGDSLYFHVNSVLSGERTFKNGESHLCWDTRNVIISTTAQGGLLVSSVPRYTRDDHALWSGAISSSYISNAKLIRKNGFYFLDIALDVPSALSADSLGTVTFSGLAAADISAIAAVPFYAHMFVEVTARGVIKAVPLVLEFNATVYEGEVELTLALGDDLNDSAGSAYIRVQYPTT